MSLRTLSLLTVLLCLTACGATAPAAAPAGWDAFGAGIAAEAGTPQALDAILADAAAHDGVPVLLEGTIDEVCQVKGCWMTLSSGDQSVRVKFQDYAFFVPKDIAGRTVRIEGLFSVRDVPVDEARHYLEDAGRTEEAAAITEPQRSYEIMATGVLVRAE